MKLVLVFFIVCLNTMIFAEDKPRYENFTAEFDCILSKGLYEIKGMELYNPNSKNYSKNSNEQKYSFTFMYEILQTLLTRGIEIDKIIIKSYAPINFKEDEAYTVYQFLVQASSKIVELKVPYSDLFHKVGSNL